MAYVALCLAVQCGDQIILSLIEVDDRYFNFLYNRTCDRNIRILAMDKDVTESVASVLEEALYTTNKTVLPHAAWMCISAIYAP